MPDIVGGEIAVLFQSGNGRHERTGPGGNDDVTRGQRLAIHLDGIRGNDAPLALDDVNAECLVTRDGVMRLHLSYHSLYSVHDVGEVEIRAGGSDPELGRTLELCQKFRRAQQRLGRHTAGIQAVAAHAMLFNQSHFGFQCRGNVCTDETAGPRSDDHDITIESARPRPTPKRPTRLDHAQSLSREQRQDAQRHK